MRILAFLAALFFSLAANAQVPDLGGGINNSLASTSTSGGTGTVTSFSFTNANGATGTVATSTTTPNLTLAPTAGGTFASSANNLGFFSPTTSAQLAGVISDETGTGVLVFNASPNFTGTITAAASNFSGAVTSLSDTTSGLTVNGNSSLSGTTTISSAQITGGAINATPIGLASTSTGKFSVIMSGGPIGLGNTGTISGPQLQSSNGSNIKLCASASCDVTVQTSGGVTVGTSAADPGANNFAVSGLTVANGGQEHFRRTVSDVNATLANTDYLLAYTAVTAARVIAIACTIGSATTPQFFVIKDESGGATALNTLTVTPSSGTIDGSSSKVVVNAASGVGRIYANGTNCFTW